MRLRHGMGLAAFCLLAGSEWLVDAIWPATRPSLLTRSIALAFAGTCTVIVRLVRPLRVQVDAPRTMRVAAASLPLFAVPAMVGHLGSAVGPETSVALYALAPLCIVGAAAFANESARALTVPALAGAAGLWLILPWKIAATGGEAIAFAAVLLSVFLAAAASVWIHGLLQGPQLRRMLAVVAFTNAAALALTGLAQGERGPGLASLAAGLLRGLLIGMPQICVLLWLLREIAPERVASRFFFVPLVTLLEGVALLHARPDMRTGFGLLLLLGGAVGLLFVKGETPLGLDLR